MISVTNLPPGITVYIDIRAYKNTTMGDPFTIPLKTEGVPDEKLNVTAVLIKEKRTSVHVSWSAPTADRYKNRELEYEVNYIHLPEWKNNGGLFFFKFLIFICKSEYAQYFLYFI